MKLNLFSLLGTLLPALILLSHLQTQAKNKVNLAPNAVLSVSYPDPQNLRKVKFSSRASKDPDGKIVNAVVHFGDGQTAAANPTVIHEYHQDGTYQVQLTVTDNAQSNTSVSKTIRVASSNELTVVGSIWGPENLNSQKKEFTTTLTRSADQIDELYLIQVKNADGLEHQIEKCQGTRIEKITCRIRNIQNKIYTETFRVQSAKIFINELEITAEDKINQSTAVFSAYLNLSEINQLRFKIKGSPLSYIQVQIMALDSQRDRTAPVLNSNITSNTLTRDPNVQMTITDASAVSTEIYKNNILLETRTDKNFNFTLSEGIHDYRFVTTDAEGNISEPLVLSSVHLDTTPPVSIYSNFKTIYYYQQTPSAIQIDFQFNEALSSFTINQQPVPAIGTLFSYQLPVSGPGYYQLNAQVTDLAGNSAQRTLTLRLVVDSQAPNISLGATPDLIDLDQISFPVMITDLIGTVSQVKVNGVTILSGILAPQFQVSYPTVAEGIYNFEIMVIDLAGNMTVFNKIITKRNDIVPPSISHNINPSTFVRSFPRIVQYQFHTNEPLSELIVNGQILNSIDYSNYIYSFEITAAGQYTFAITATDLAGNRTQFSAQTTIQQDSEPPQIITGPIPGIITENTYLFQYQIVDTNPTWTTFILDGVAFPSTNQNNVSFLLDFTQQNIHEIILIATDLAGNSTSQYYRITQNTAPLAVNFMSPQSGATYPSQNLQIRLQANKPLTAASINGVPVTINNDQISFGQNITVPNEGQYTFTAQVTDIYGQTAQTQVTFEIKTRSIASWEYQECPAQ